MKLQTGTPFASTNNLATSALGTIQVSKQDVFNVAVTTPSRRLRRELEAEEKRQVPAVLPVEHYLGVDPRDVSEKGAGACVRPR